MLYLVDKSAWEQRRHSETVNDYLKGVIRSGEAATCEIIRMEILYSARSVRDYQKINEWLGALEHLTVTRDCWRSALETQARLAECGKHRRPIPDLITAATAMTHNATVLHYDHDFDLSSEITGQPTKWIAERGTLG